MKENRRPLLMLLFKEIYTYRNESPLCAASEIGYFEVTKLLLRHKPRPNINFKTYKGRTGLSLAASCRREQVVMQLYKDPQARNGSNLKRAIKAASSSKITHHLQAYLVEQGSFCA
ncbi:hypothetical protein N7509_001465 [Penicillium cosmopolitanum]|uniref:Ankyrin repeat protein n=1 Tax=Penicillium cosmopolitanum TaxID=1131564 RepID=A0A9W9W719_9EURO|nr:uncharacterized protein N7509_001465 [Penicillium cosmopolitanum]KAJ5407582.1 hypothetical protein N7509_001465 [Penicillium cosmopolitanum]